MDELETALIANFRSNLSSWRHFVDDSIYFVKKDSVKFVLTTFENFHKIINYTSEEEIDRKTLFLDALLVRIVSLYRNRIYQGSILSSKQLPSLGN